VVFVVGVAAALSLAVGYVLQQRAAQRTREARLLSARLIFDLLHRPMWWCGIGAMVIGQLLGGLALQLAAVSVVEPLLSTNLLFALAISAVLSDHRLQWGEIAGAVLLSAALGVFIAVGNPHSSPRPAPNRAVIVLAVCVVAAVVVVLIGAARRRRLLVESVLLATATGLLYGLQDAATRSALQVADHRSVSAVFMNPWVYIVIGSAAVGILISQSAFKAARLDYSLPPIAAAEPIAGIALGVSLLGDVISVSPGGLAAEAACVVAMVVGVILIARSRTLGHPVERPDPSPAAVGQPAPDRQTQPGP
jgi:drug/metabolite transporter (DMT)-like permease